MDADESTTISTTKAESILNELSGLFPTFSRSEIKERIESCSNVDALIDAIFRELEYEEQHSIADKDPQSSYLYLLKDIFPDKPNSELKTALEKCNNNIETASAFLLEGSNITKTLEKSPHLTLDDLVCILGLSSSIIRPYFARNTYDPMRTVLDIIVNYKKEYSIPKSKIPSGGRVQGGSAKHITSVERYNINENSTEFKELKSIYVSNPQFSTMNDNFFEKGLEFFKGDVGKVVEIATIILDYNAAALTHEFTPKVLSKIPLSEVLKASVDEPSSRRKEQPNSYSNKWKSPSQQKSNGQVTNLNSAQARSKSPRTFVENNADIGDRFRRLDSTGVLDLHGLVVSDALVVVQDALSPWWDQEITERLNHGRLDQFGSTAVFMDQLHIITGRGLHSVDGVSKVKKSVKNYLTRTNYIFEENPGSLNVIGKKKTSK